MTPDAYGVICRLLLTVAIVCAPACGGTQASSERHEQPAESVRAEGGSAPSAAAPTDDEPTEPALFALASTASYIITVRTEGWADSTGTLARFRRGFGGSWVREGADVAVILGRSGLGWGRGAHGVGAPDGHDGPVKEEGDGRSPAGAFWLDQALGYAPDPPAGTRIPYQPMTTTVQCIEDTSSAYYNRIVDPADVASDWDSTDRLRRVDGLYELLLFVGHNVDPPKPGAGSCILLHVWSSPTSTTSGCTAMPRDALEEVIQHLAPERNLLVQLPDDVYTTLAEPWALPHAAPD